MREIVVVLLVGLLGLGVVAGLFLGAGMVFHLFRPREYNETSTSLLRRWAIGVAVFAAIALVVVVLPTWR